MKAPILAAVLLVSVPTFQDEPAPQAERLHLASVYGAPFDTPTLRSVSRVSLTGRFADGEQVFLMLDNNSCGSFSPFGDESECTERGGWFQGVRLKRVRVKDPLELGRQLFLLDHEDFAGRLLLVSAEGDGWRLIQRDAQDKVTHVLSLERRPMPAYLKEQDEQRP